MANLSKIMGKVMNFIPKTEGAAGKIRLSKLQLDEIAKQGGEDGKILQQLLSGTKNPTLDVAYKAKSNYSIAGIKLQDGKQVLGQGAVSVVNPGRSDAVIKYKFSAGKNGKLSSSNGFIDGGKPVDAKDIAAGFTRRGGNVTVDVSSGKAFAGHLAANEDGIIDLAKKIGADTLLENYVKGTNDLQRSLDQFMVAIRQWLRGEQIQTPVCEKIAKSANMVEPLKLAKIAPKTVDMENIKIGSNWAEQIKKLKI